MAEDTGSPIVSPQPASTDFRAQRRSGLVSIVISLAVGAGLWLAIYRLLPPLPGMDDVLARLVLTLKCGCVAVLFSLVLGVEAVAHERLNSPAFDPLVGYETRRLRVNL
ncbi:MAG TPA: hypothetical protein VM782_05115, partial [Stellaceae bacterium]|nr:hypothetical protein [Stellaceae bacterium]